MLELGLPAGTSAARKVFAEIAARKRTLGM
jgi:hypothetical protein